MIKVIVKKPNQSAEAKEVENDLKTFQNLVGGYIEVLPVGNNILLVCNEEGKLEELEPNFRLGNDVIVGDAVFVADGNDGEFHSLSEGNIQRLLKMFS